MSDLFAYRYREARDAFLGEARAAGLEVGGTADPWRKARDGGALVQDWARSPGLGHRPVLLVTSGVHGAEAVAGSALQRALLAEAARFDARGVDLLLVHAVNPYGYDQARRIDDHNIDLNRNVVDHAVGAYPANRHYAALHPDILPEALDGAAKEAADARLWAFIAEHGERVFETAVSQGQYTHPDGIGFGGHARSWAIDALAAAIRPALGAPRLLWLDIHTGLGAYGALERIGTRADMIATAREALGDAVTDVNAGESIAPPISGAVAELLGPARPHHAAVALEFGSRPPDTVFEAYRAETWLHGRGNPDAESDRLEPMIRDAYAPDEAAWRDRVLEAGLAEVERALDWLAG